MRIAGINGNDFVNGEGVCVSLFLQGCPHHCKGCHNPETWNFQGGQEINIEDLKKDLKEKIYANNLTRNFSLLGGEPLCPQNFPYSLTILSYIKEISPTSLIYVWTGYTLKELKELYKDSTYLSNIDVLIEGRFILEQRDITLKLRGSRNQKILYKNKDF